MDFLAWENVGYLCTFILGCMLLLMSMMGLGDHDASIDHDIDHNVGHDHDTGHEQGENHSIKQMDLVHESSGHEITHDSTLMSSVLNFIGIGKCPLSIILMAWLLLFSLFGVCSNIILKPILVTPYVYGVISYIGAFILSFLLIGRLARWVGKIMPTSQTYVLTNENMVGSIAIVIHDFDPKTKTSYAQFYDKNKTVHEVKVKNACGKKIKKNDEVLIVKFDKENEFYEIEPVPTEVALGKK